MKYKGLEVIEPKDTLHFKIFGYKSLYKDGKIQLAHGLDPEEQAVTLEHEYIHHLIKRKYWFFRTELHDLVIVLSTVFFFFNYPVWYIGYVLSFVLNTIEEILVHKKNNELFYAPKRIILRGFFVYLVIMSLIFVRDV